MNTLLALALQSAWNRRGTLGLMIFSIALSVILLLGVEQLRQSVRNGFKQSVSGTDLIVGARTSSVQLMLYAIFHIGEATHNMSWSSFESLAQRPLVAWAVPVTLGDAHHGFPVVGTTGHYFQYFQYGNRQSLAFAAGVPFQGIFEAVIGADVAEALNYSVASELTLEHGSSHREHAEHADKPFKVVGILKRTGTPVDRSIHVSLEAIEAVHLDWQGGAPLPGVSIPAQYVTKFDLHPKTITAALIGLKRRSAVFQMQRYVNQFKDESLLGVMPGIALDELWSILAIVEKTLLAVAGLVVGVGLSGLAAVVLAGLGERRRELAILRSVGAGPFVIFWLLTIEGVLMVIAGSFMGTVATIALIRFGGPLLQTKLGVTLTFTGLTANAWWLLGLVMLCGTLVSLAPGYRAYRLSLIDGLMPRV